MNTTHLEKAQEAGPTPKLAIRDFKEMAPSLRNAFYGAPLADVQRESLPTAAGDDEYQWVLSEFARDPKSPSLKQFKSGNTYFFFAAKSKDGSPSFVKALYFSTDDTREAEFVLSKSMSWRAPRTFSRWGTDYRAVQRG